MLASAAIGGDPEIISLLSKHKGLLNLEDKVHQFLLKINVSVFTTLMDLFCVQDGLTPLHSAALSNNMAAVVKLLDLGANTSAISKVSKYYNQLLSLNLCFSFGF